MPSFQSHIYGDVPVMVEIEPSGSIISICVLKPEYEQGIFRPLYWLDYDAVEGLLFEQQFSKEIDDCLSGARRIV